jgi:hypothetical protein
VNCADALPAVTTTYPCLVDIVGLSSAVIVKSAPVSPDAGSTNTQSGAEDTDQDGPFVVTVVVTGPPVPANTKPEVGESEIVGGPGSWVTVKIVDAPPAVTTIEPDRSNTVGFVETVTWNSPPLTPDAPTDPRRGGTTVKNDEDDNADHDG